MFPGERPSVCRNRELTAERGRKREELLAATERKLLASRRRSAAGTRYPCAPCGSYAGHTSPDAYFNRAADLLE
jgi:hypothetical protein